MNNKNLHNVKKLENQVMQVSSLKVMSSENYSGSKIPQIVGYWSGTVALRIILNF
jgi:hypothetical protein